MYSVKTNLVGNFNVYNLLAAIAALNETGYDLERIIEKCAHIAQVEGRMAVSYTHLYYIQNRFNR